MHCMPADTRTTSDAVNLYTLSIMYTCPVVRFRIYLLTYCRQFSSQSEQSTILLTLYHCIIAFSSYVILLLYKHISFRFFCTFCIFCFVFAADFIGE